MDELMLIKPKIEYQNQIKEYRSEFLINAESMDGTSSLVRYEDISLWLEWLSLGEKKETCAKNFVPSTQYLCIRVIDNRIVGMIDIRHELNEYLLKSGGHIGYSIKKSERGKGYAKEQLRLALIKCRDINLDKVLVCCYKDNILSRKTIISNGGIYDGEVLEDSKITERYWIYIK